ncbi:hypothetical protein J4458_07025 [Candidatus Woesearchaeota archaeon]|nr:hypothetical protein [Candidatus Woesearchaeota archaeon]
MDKPKKVISPKSWDKYEVDNVLKGYIARFLQGKVEIPGATKKELVTFKLNPGYHEDGLEVILADPRFSSKSAEEFYRSFDYEIAIPSRPGGYTLIFGTRSSKYRGDPSLKGDSIIIKRHISPRFWDFKIVPYSYEEQVAIKEIIDHFGLGIDPHNPQALFSFHYPTTFKPKNMKELQDHFRRLFLGAMTIEQYLADQDSRYKEIARVAINKGTQKYG